jgi:coenzyme F420 hydrogenase subunit beta
MSCQASINGTLLARGVNKYARRIELTLGLLCSKSFGYDGLRRVVTEEYGVPLEDVAKVNIKGRFQLWRRSTGEQVEIPLKQLAQATREGCKLCPDFAAEHADIATGGLGQRDGWTLAVVRTARGEEWLTEAEAAGVVTVRPGEEDPAALALMAKLAARSRGRWPVELGGDRAAPRMLPVVQTSGGSARTT